MRLTKQTEGEILKIINLLTGYLHIVWSEFLAQYSSLLGTAVRLASV